jgi:hypothetical protein
MGGGGLSDSGRSRSKRSNSFMGSKRLERLEHLERLEQL